MNKSESIVKLAVALLKAQKGMGGATKGAKNPFFKSSYADYGAVLEACKDSLNESGVSILQPHVSIEGKNFVETILLHESGEWLSSNTEVICAKQNDPQALGSAITYARRYGLQSLVALPSEDDDGEKATGRSTGFQKAATPTVAKAPVAGTTAVAVTSGTPAATPTTASKPKPNFHKPAVAAAKPVVDTSEEAMGI